MLKIIIRLSIGIPLLLVIASLIVNIVLTLALTLTYSTLTKENVIATIRFEKIANQDKIYIAHLYGDDGLKIGDYKIYGDQWRIDASFIKMKYWANIFGIDSKYALNRLEGRYANIKDENNKKHKAYLLETNIISDTFSFFIDTQYGSSVYKSINTNMIHTVLKSQSGLIVRSGG